MTNSDTLTGRMAAHLVGGFEPTPEMRAKALLCLTDFFSGAYEAAPLEWSQQAAGIAVPFADGAALIAGKMAAVPGDAAFANAVAAHGLVREDMHKGNWIAYKLVVTGLFQGRAGV